MGENPPHQLGGMGEHCKLTIGVWGRTADPNGELTMLLSSMSLKGEGNEMIVKL